MKKLLSLTIALFIFQFGYTQTDVSLLLDSSWELSTLNGAPAEDALMGSRWHFLSDSLLLMENPSGTLSLPIVLKPESILLQGRELPIAFAGEDEFFVTDATEVGDRRIGFKRLSGSVPAVPVSAKAGLGQLQLSGFYYYVEELSPLSYHYFRFYEDGEVLEVTSVLPPEEIVPFLNRAYFSNAQDLRWKVFTKVAKEASGLVYDRAAVPQFSSREEKLLTTLTFAPNAEGADLLQVTRWENDERSYDRELSLMYYPTTALATWRGSALTKDAPGVAEELFLVRPLPVSNIINSIVQEMPRFPGCEEIEDPAKRKSCSQTELLKFIYMNITYPKLARENGIEGTTVVTFVVEKDGSISNVRLVRDIGGGCGEESVRVVESMQAQDIRWSSGKMYGEPVRVQFNLPIKFKLEGTVRKKRRRGRG